MRCISATLARSVAVFYCVASGAALAQTTPNSTAAGNDNSSGALTDIVVTAQRREQSAQSVPITITQYSADQLTQLGVTGTGDLPLAIPGFAIVPTGPGLGYYLRGVGNNQNFPTVENEVATYIDGVYMPFPDGNLQNFNNIASIEVDKGPQGTLLGRNATGGAIQINTKDPSQQPSADITIGYGNYNTTTDSFYGTTGVTRDLATDLAVYFNDQMDGWGTDLANGQQVFKNYNLGVRNKWLYNVSDSTDIRFAAYYSENRGSDGADIRPVPGQSTLFNEATGVKFTIPGSYNVDSNLLPLYDVHQGGADVKINSDFGWAQGVSISAWGTNKAKTDIDYDGTPINFLSIINNQTDTAFTQEFQLLSAKDSSVTWAAGVFYLNRIGENEPFGFNGIATTGAFGAPPGEAFNIFATESNRSYALYGQATKEVLPATRLTLGARFTVDNIAVHGATFAGSTEVPGSGGSTSVQYKEPTYRVSLDHDITSDVLAFISYNRGYHAGIYNLNSTSGFTAEANPPVNPEIINAYEAGIKSEFLDKRIRLNASGFWYNYSNLQQQEYEGASVVTVNAASARIRGIDLDISARPFDQLTLSAAAEFLDTEFLSYPTAVFYTLTPSGALDSAPGNAAGNQLPNAPRFSANANANYTFDTGVGSFVSSATAFYNGGWFADPGNDYKQPAYWLFNLSETWHAPGNRYDVALWVKNLGNKDYDEGVNPLTPVGYVGNPGPPRTFGIQFGFHL